MLNLPLPLLALLCCLVAPARAALTVPDGAALARENGVLTAQLDALRAAGATLDLELREIARRLAADEASAFGARVDTLAVRTARLELDAARARGSVIPGQINQVALRLQRVRTSIGALAGAPAELLAPAERAAALAALHTQADLLGRIGALYQTRLRGDRQLEALLAERLRLLQGRLRLDPADESFQLARDPRVPELQAAVDDALRAAALARAQMTAVVGEDAAAQAERARHAAAADAAVTRAFLGQNELERLLVAHWLEALAALRNDDLTPLAVLRAGAIRLTALDSQLAGITEAVVNQERAVAAQRDLLARPPATDPEALAGLTTLAGEVAAQQGALTLLGQSLAAERAAYAAAIARRGANALLERRPLPTTAEAWARVAGNLGRLPALALTSLREHGAMLRERVRALPTGRWALLALLAPALGAGVWWLRRRLLRGPRAADRAALAAALISALPAALFGLLGWHAGLDRTILLPALILLLLWPAGALLLALAHQAASRSPDDAGAQAMVRHLRAGLPPALLIGALYLLSRLLPLAPVLADLFDRLAMLGLLALTPPAVAARRLLMQGAMPVPGPARLALWLLPGFLVGTAALGLLGFANLAWTLLADFGLALLVAIGLWLVLALLADLARGLDARLARRGGELEALWRTHFLEPGHRLAQLLAVGLAGWGLARLWGWDARSPVVGWLRDLLGTPLFSIGPGAFTPADGLIAAALVVLSLWVGGWMQQVGYGLAYRGVRDVGLRRALALLTRYCISVAGVLLALRLIGLDLTTLMVFAASLGVGLGFGLQQVVNNFLSGLLLLGERPLRVGDYVRIGEQEGYVTAIGIRSLSILTEDQQEVFIPNASVIAEPFSNFTRTDSLLRQTDLVGIGYDDDRERAMALVAGVLATNPLVVPLPTPLVFLWDYGDSSVVLRFEYHIDIRDGIAALRRARSDILLEIGRRFASAGIAFAYPHRDVRLSLDPADRRALVARTTTPPAPTPVP